MVRPVRDPAEAYFFSKICNLTICTTTLIIIDTVCRRMTLIQMNVQNDDIDRVLTLCNGFKFAAICLSLDMYITRVNHVAELLLLHSEPKLINKSFHEICREMGIDPPIASTAKPETIEQSSIPTSHWLSNHELVNVHWSISCCLDEEGYTGYIMVGKIIVTCVAKQPLIQMENILRALPCAVFTKDKDSCCITVNKYQAELAGFANEKDMIGKSDYDMPWCDVADVIRKADALTLSENKTIVLEEYAIVADGTKSAFLVTKSPFRDEHGNVLGIAGTSINITRQRQTLFSDDSTPSLDHWDNNASKIYLSKKEIACVNWMIKGKSSLEIATIFGISKRTVEAHMNNIKRKLNCYKQFQVGYLVGKYGYLLL